jgi:hypothetical protein
MAGTAAVGRRTEAHVLWTLAPVPDGTRVRLEATVERAGRGDAILLAAGGRHWLQGRFDSILETLARRVAHRAAQRSSA